MSFTEVSEIEHTSMYLDQSGDASTNTGNVRIFRSLYDVIEDCCPGFQVRRKGHRLADTLVDSIRRRE